MTAPDPDMERARERAHELGGFYKHVVIYVLVCSLLVVIDLADNTASGTEFMGLSWAYWPILGWGIAVVIQGVSVAFQGSNWEDRKAAELYEKQQQRPLGHH